MECYAIIKLIIYSPHLLKQDKCKCLLFTPFNVIIDKKKERRLV